MRIHRLLLLLFIIFGAHLAATPVRAQPEAGAAGNKKVHHLVIVWLKQHGDPDARKQYIEGSKRLSKLPGVLSYDIGPVAQIKRDKPSPSLDDSFDIAVSATFENQQALQNYSKHPEHQKVIQEVLKPLVDKYLVYDFFD